MAEALLTSKLPFNGEACKSDDKSDDDDGSANELFESLMEIANDPALQDEARPSVELGENLTAMGAVTELNHESSFDTTEAKEVKAVGANNREQSVDSEITAQSIATDSVVQIESGTEIERSGGKSDPGVEKRLSKAVVDLEGLEQQLSTMIASFQPGPTKKEIVGGKVENEGSEAEATKSDEKCDDELNQGVEADNKVTSSVEELSTKNDKEQEVISTTDSTRPIDAQSSLLSQNSQHDILVNEKELTPDSFTEQKVSAPGSQQDIDGSGTETKQMLDEPHLEENLVRVLPNDGNEETAENQPVNNTACEQEITMSDTVQVLESESESCTGSHIEEIQTDEQSAESTAQKDKDIAYENSSSEDPRSQKIAQTDVQSSDCLPQMDKEVACEKTAPANVTTQEEQVHTDLLPSSAHDINCPDTQAPTKMPEKANSLDGLDQEGADAPVFPSGNSVPEIEILRADESSTAERKSLDSLDTDESSRASSQPGSPAQSDEGIDSDSRSDYGDDDDGLLDPDALHKFRPKSWYLEVASRDSIHSDSSIEGEPRDAKSSDGTDGKYISAGSLGTV